MTIAYDGDTYPASAKCGACGEWMPQVIRLIISSMDQIKWFTAQSKLHMKRKHLHGYADSRSSGSLIDARFLCALPRCTGQVGSQKPRRGNTLSALLGNEPNLAHNLSA
jgi:hypothetical protein